MPQVVNLYYDAWENPHVAAKKARYTGRAGHGGAYGSDRIQTFAVVSGAPFARVSNARGRSRLILIEEG